nr:PilL N-terminal domain-containing protein [Pseudomonas bharatica]
MIRHLTTLSLVALVAGCAIQKAEQPSKPAFDSSRNPEWLSPDIYPNGATPEKEPVVRYGRYTLVSTQPDASQRDLMAQIIDVTIPSSMNPSVRDAMLYVVDRSGYVLCPPSSQHVDILYTRPLPAAQYKLGPMTLRNTLQVLAGPAWQVKVDEVNRQVCFVLRPGYQLPTPSAPTGQLYADKVRAPSTSSATPATASGVVVAAVTAPTPITATPPLSQSQRQWAPRSPSGTCQGWLYPSCDFNRRGKTFNNCAHSTNSAQPPRRCQVGVGRNHSRNSGPGHRGQARPATPAAASGMDGRSWLNTARQR